MADGGAASASALYAKADHLDDCARRLRSQAAQYRTLLAEVRKHDRPETWTGPFANASSTRMRDWQRMLDAAALELEQTATHWGQRASALRSEAKTAAAQPATAS